VNAHTHIPHGGLLLTASQG